MAAYARYSAMVMQMGLLIAAGAFGGYQLDKLFRPGFPVFALVLSLVAVAGAIWLLIREITDNKEK